MDEFKKFTLKRGVDYSLMDSPTIPLFGNAKLIKHLRNRRARKALKLELKLKLALT